jgi:hypothetical protein
VVESFEAATPAYSAKNDANAFIVVMVFAVLALRIDDVWKYPFTDKVLSALTVGKLSMLV